MQTYVNWMRESGDRVKQNLIKLTAKKKKNRSSRNHIAMSGKILKQDFFHLGSVLIT